MIFIKGEKINENKIKIILVHHMPETLTEEEKIGGYFIESMPEPPAHAPIGHVYVPFLNLETKEVFFELESRPLSQEDLMKQKLNEIELLQERIELLQQALDDLLLGGM
ncbi:hypothetical protein [Thermotalea metallivorans]|uniref:Uncharacterized protein n=1 Tax=Thermotalea metallivorans TaxID=520762 RepID=A0A140LCM4_9FIRM|nr:hypothetical protein [Thermotalea metallivorans]KXG78299.1 hypothetical protein AN619_02740 [Thermotalea metallivorans]